MYKFIETLTEEIIKIVNICYTNPPLTERDMQGPQILRFSY